ncbi:Protein of unknown function [Pseudomonas sp. ok272]|uniref:DUF2790 domain-containing protein n=1 Tax=unclassified Pseudomonas TaxID=196821 RepID=UPI0008CD4372|nr:MULTISPECIES: DUF2790 domain-containing protein [unclassified Pseudomonas]SEM92340.1 Protein of unknown function [Pseudomonas sp. ok272]SFM95840.1 Protein of unknown function [Pseudomonas sp. ok602]
MKTLISLFLSLVASAAMATDSTPYDPAQPLDIARVISVTDTATACEVVPATMVYVDHQGQTHSVTYSVMGACTSSL